MAKPKKQRIVNKYVRDESWKIHYFHAKGKCFYPKSEEEYLETMKGLNGDRITILKYSHKESGKLSSLKNYLSPEEFQNPPYEITIAISKRFKAPPKRKSLENKTSPERQ